MSKMRGVAVYTNSNNEVEEIVLRPTELKEDNMRYSKQLEDLGYKMIFCLFTTDSELFHKALLKTSVLVLRCTTKYYNDYLQERMGFVPDDVLAETQRLQDCYIETLMRKVARRVRWCLNRDIEVTDELAILCYNFAEQHKEECVFQC